MVQHSTGNMVVYVKDCGYLVRSIDAWGRMVPEFVKYPEWAIGLTEDEAKEQRNFLHWAPWRIPEVQVKKR